MKLTILVDMDDTVENLAATWIGMVNERYGTSARPENQRVWDMSQAFPELDKEQVYEFLREEELYYRVQPLPGAQEYLKKLFDEGHDIYFVTVNPHHTVHAKFEGIVQRYFPFIDWDHMIITRNKHLIRGDVLVDDGPHNLEGAKYRKILFTAAHNRDYDAEGNGMIRVDNWEEAYAEIQNIRKEKEEES